MQKQERKAEEAEKKRNERIDREDFMRSIQDPQTLRTMTETQIVEQGRKHGLTFAQIDKLKTDRKKEIKDAQDPKMLHNQNVKNAFINDILDSAQIKDEDARAAFGQYFRIAIKKKEDEQKRPLTDEEIKQAGIEGLQTGAMHYNTGKKGFLGFGAKEGAWESGQETNKKPSDYKVGDTYEKDGKTYKKIGDGKWQVVK
jgi:uncharacterized protein (DUF2249 family)